MKDLYQKALDLISKIKTIENGLESLDELKRIDSTKTINLRGESKSSESYIFATVRSTTLATYLHGELKELNKELAALEAEIKSSL